MSTRQRAQLAMTDEAKREGSTTMSVRSSKEGFAWSEKTRALAAGLLVAGMMAACLILVANSAAHAATTFTVNSTGDGGDLIQGDGVCDAGGPVGSQCTLRAAIQEANATAGADVINFAIPGTGVKTISPASALPVITDQVTIDGYTQTGAFPNTKAVGNDATLKIQLDGTNASGADGLAISNSSGSVIKGLVINRFGGGEGVVVDGDSVGNRIEGNFIGTNPAGTLDKGNAFDGVAILGGPSQTVVGGTTRAARNVISGNDEDGIVLNNNANANSLQGNYIGTDRSGTKDLGNQDGIAFFNTSSNNIVGGTTTASRNVISGNDEDGIRIAGGAGNRVVGNRIGTTASGTGPLGNALEGIAITSAQNFVGDRGVDNIIAFNGGEGINVSGGTANRIDANSIFSNGAIGIDLSGGVEDAAGRTANDLGDTDTGSNGLQNFPVITSAKTISGKTTIKGKLNTLPNPNADVGYNIQLFSNPSGGDEGKTLIGEPQVTPDSSGNATFTFSPSSTVAVGRTITATAQSSSPIPLDDGNTSEFSAPRTVASS